MIRIKASECGLQIGHILDGHSNRLGHVVGNSARYSGFRIVGLGDLRLAFTPASQIAISHGSNLKANTGGIGELS